MTEVFQVSEYIEEMSDEELRDYEQSLHHTIYGDYACFGTTELRHHQETLKEMGARDVDPVEGEITSAGDIEE